MREILKLKGTPRGEAHRIEVEEMEPLEFHDKEYEMEHHVPDYSPAKPLPKTKIVNQKPKKFGRK